LPSEHKGDILFVDEVSLSAKIPDIFKKRGRFYFAEPYEGRVRSHHTARWASLPPCQTNWQASTTRQVNLNFDIYIMNV
jgi:hypothetical protein